MKQSHMPYIQAVARLSQDSVTRTLIAAAAVALATAHTQSVPSAPVANAEQHYAANCAMLTRGEVGEYNEEAVIDVASAIELTRKFWLLRYNSVHCAALTPPVKGAFFMGLTGASRFFSANEIEFLNENAEEIFMITSAIDSVKSAKAELERRAVANAAPSNPVPA